MKLMIRLIFTLLEPSYISPSMSVAETLHNLCAVPQARSTPMGAGSMPMVGGQMSSFGGSFGSQKIATPKELVKMLDQYVVGQTHAKKVLFLLAIMFAWQACSVG